MTSTNKRQKVNKAPWLQLGTKEKTEIERHFVSKAWMEDGLGGLTTELLLMVGSGKGRIDVFRCVPTDDPTKLQWLVPTLQSHT